MFVLTLLLLNNHRTTETSLNDMHPIITNQRFCQGNPIRYRHYEDEGNNRNFPNFNIINGLCTLRFCQNLYHFRPTIVNYEYYKFRAIFINELSTHFDSFFFWFNCLEIRDTDYAMITRGHKFFSEAFVTELNTLSVCTIFQIYRRYLVGRVSYLVVHNSSSVGTNFKWGNSVFIGSETSIGHNVFLKNNVCVGNKCFIGDNVVIDNNSIIGSYASIGANYWLLEYTIMGFESKTWTLYLNKLLNVPPILNFTQYGDLTVIKDFNRKQLAKGCIIYTRANFYIFGNINPATIIMPFQ